jgi:superfamily II DNA helicase RecQ
MQVKIISVPVVGGERVNEELNVFLRSKKILQMDKSLVNNDHQAFWSFCIKYIEDTYANDVEKAKIDYRQVLDEATFKQFAKLREVRKQIAQSEGIPAYAIFTDEELSGIAKLPEWSLSALKNIKGIGSKKAEKYGERIIKAMENA